MMFSKKNAVLWIVGALLLSLSTGCARNEMAVDQGDLVNNEQPADTNLNNNTNNTNNGIFPGNGGSTGNYQTPVTITPVIDKKTSGVWIFKKIKTVSFTLQNPSNQNVSGKLVITFTKKGQQTEMIEKPFTITPAGTTTVDNVEPSKSADEVTATANVDTGMANNGGTTGGFPATGGTGSGSGSYPW